MILIARRASFALRLREQLVAPAETDCLRRTDAGARGRLPLRPPVGAQSHLTAWCSFGS